MLACLSLLLVYLIESCSRHSPLGGLIFLVRQLLFFLLNALLILGLCVLIAWAFSVVELSLGLHFARFDWENPAEVVKQGGGVLLSMLITFLIVGAAAALVIFFGNAGAAALCALLVLVALPVRLIMGRRAEKTLTKL